MKSKNNKLSVLLAGVSGAVVLAVAVIAINIIAARLYGRLDLTEDKIYTLSKGTKNILEKMSDGVVVKFYFSRSTKQLPTMIKTYGTRVEEVLREYANRSAGKLTLEVFDPKPDTDDEEWARKYGLQAITLGNGDPFYFGAVLLQSSREFILPYFDPRREEFLEYDISEALVQVQNKTKAKVGILSSLPVIASSAPMMMPMAETQPSWIFVEQLRKNFEVVEVAATSSSIDDQINVLLIIHPKMLQDSTLYAIDQFVMRGGRLLVAVDPFSRLDLSMSGNMARMSGRMPEISSDLKTLFTAWDIDYNPGKVVGDLSAMIQINAGGMTIPYPYFINMRNDRIDRQSVITQKLNQVMVAEGGAFELKSGSKFEFLPLLKTSAEAGTADGMFASFMGPAEFAKQLKTENKSLVQAAVVNGDFVSAFKDGPPAPSPDSKEKANIGKEHLSAVKQRNSIVLIADVDFVHDSNAVEQFRFGPQVISRPRNDNIALLLNAVDFLAGSSDLISIRSKGKITRPFTKVEELQKAAQQKWQQEEDRLSSRLSELEKKLNELQGQRADGSQLSMSADQQRELGRFRQEEADVRKARREVRKNLREDIESLGNYLIVTNLLIVPLGVGIFGMAVFISRQRRMKRREST